MTDTGKRGVLVIFAKRPEAGRVKTRMCPPLLPEQAAALYAAMLEDVLAVSSVVAARTGASLWLHVHPPGAVSEMAAHHPGFHVTAQQGADLSERMAHAVEEASRAGFTHIVLRGSDNPALGAGDLVAGFEALDDADLVVGPDRDGGYGWIGLRQPVPGLFDHPMSTERVLDDTLAGAARAGLRTRTLGVHFDLDRAEDFALLAEARRAGRADCPRTLALLDREGLWSPAPGAPPPS